MATVLALYGSAMTRNQFDYASYIYLIAPISLAIINPIGLTLMEFQKQSEKRKFEPRQVYNKILMWVGAN